MKDSEQMEEGREGQKMRRRTSTALKGVNGTRGRQERRNFGSSSAVLKRAKDGEMRG